MNPHYLRTSRQLLWLLALAAPAAAQQAIVNMPSADITGRKEYFVMHETQWRQWNPGRYWYGTNFFTYGIAKNTEFALTTYNSGTPRAPNENIGIGFKSGIPLYGKSQAAAEHRITVGTMGTYNLRGQGLGNFSYGHYSFRTPNHTRWTVGGWFGTEALFKKTTGNWLAAVEHPVVNKKFYVLAEWFRGNHDFGFLIPGILYHPTPRQVVVVAYKIANNRQNGANGIVIEYGFFWGGRKEKQDGH